MDWWRVGGKGRSAAFAAGGPQHQAQTDHRPRVRISKTSLFVRIYAQGGDRALSFGGVSKGAARGLGPFWPGVVSGFVQALTWGVPTVWSALWRALMARPLP
jgi:hypothetical protein